MKLSGEKLQEIRVKRGFSQEALAHRAGFAVRTLRRLEQGKSQPQPATLKALADSLGVEVEELCRAPATQRGTATQPATASSDELFVGRAEELATARRALAAARAGEGRVLLLAGELAEGF